jgi:hypothetical protein
MAPQQVGVALLSLARKPVMAKAALKTAQPAAGSPKNNASRAVVLPYKAAAPRQIGPAMKFRRPRPAVAAAR